METSGDPFENTGGTTADPFEDSSSDLEPNTTTTAADEVAATTPPDVPAADDAPPADVTAEEPPIVDREGVVQETAAAPTGPPATATAAGRAKLAAEGAESAQEGADGPEAATAAPEAPETETEGDGGGQEPPEDPPAPAQTPPPAEEGKKGEVRLYKLLYQTGPQQWTEADLKGVPADQKQYVQTDDGEEFLVARNNDHARRLAFTVLGRPEKGVTVELVARTSWKPKKLSVAPPEPSRERLVIS